MFTQVSPREIFLEREVSRLQGENKYLRAMTENQRPYSMWDSPGVITMNQPPHHTLNITARSGMEDRPDGLHVFVREEGYPKNMGLSYYVSKPEMYSARDRQAILGTMLEDMMRKIGEAFKD